MRPAAYARKGRHHQPRQATVRLVLIYLALGAGFGAAVTALLLRLTDSPSSAGWCP